MKKFKVGDMVTFKNKAWKRLFGKEPMPTKPFKVLERDTVIGGKIL